jgi:hypothetical protein
MDARDSTAANADLWTAYFRAQWGGWLRIMGLGRASDEVARAAAEAAGATMAAVVSAWFGPSVGRLYAANAPGVTEFVEGEAAIGDAAVDAIVPPQYARPRPRTGESQLEEWRSAARSREDAVLAY